MTKKKPVNMKAAMIRAAEMRARVIAFLNTHPGEYTSHTMAEQLGISNGDASYTASRLAAKGLINVRPEGRGKPGHYYLHPKTADVTEVEVIDPESRTIEGPLKAKRGYNRAAPKEVELVMAGVQIVVGRNPVTGRLRITLEEA
jgi:DNA-binding IscR family transcriptional regulator